MRVCGGYESNIACGHKGNTYYEFFMEESRKMREAQEKRYVFFDAYVKEMCKAGLPYVFSEDYLRSTWEIGKGETETFGSVMSFVFSDAFRATHTAKMMETVTWVGYDKYAALLSFTFDGETVYRMTIPIPRNYKSYRMGSNIPSVGASEAFSFRADKITRGSFEGCVRGWKVVCLPTYDWKICADAIEYDVVENEKEGMTSNEKTDTDK